MSLLTKSIFISNVLQNTHYNIHFYTSKYLPATFIASANQIRNYAARKGTRERRKKQKVKVEEEVKRFIPHNQRDREKYVSRMI